MHIAVDIGASSGRLVSGEMKDGKLLIQEIHRFANGYQKQGDHHCWDIDHLEEQILRGLEIAKQQGITSCTLGIDTWAVDYVLLGKDGERLRDVIAYRDSRTDGVMEQVWEKVSKSEIYRKTGIQYQSFNTIYQLFTESEELIQKTDTILLVPDYLHYRLTGKKVMEATNASTMQLMNPLTKDFNADLLALTGFHSKQFAPLIEAGTIIGELDESLKKQYDLPVCTVIAVGSHDTASAIAGVPASGKKWAYLSSGTWSLIGTERENPILEDSSLEKNFTNEWGINNTYRYLKNIIGMWVIQEIRRVYPVDYNFGEMVEAAKQTNLKQVASIDLNDARFLKPDNMIEELQDYCRETDQSVPADIGELSLTVFHNLAIAYSEALKELEVLTGESIQTLHIVGGGSQNAVLNQLTADYSGLQIVAGPTEATALGNLIVQMIAAGELESLDAGRQLIRKSFPVEIFTPSSRNKIEKNRRTVHDSKS
ncbi:rhamnulokinase [Terribacillus saccharophilus]|uniref:rhamnulokinase n=1 Tax=Terribacillus saccharophilus TaxID=361277 RepID=UPI002989FBCB|nr:rhamnulokinase [Terribacillus saccharophilus]MCM3224547.1 rhamnulokinase [Terribacillus saccharophilus]